MELIYGGLNPSSHIMHKRPASMTSLRNQTILTWNKKSPLSAAGF